MAQRITAEQIRSVVAAMNAECERAGRSSRYEVDHCNGGYKLTTNEGSAEVWSDRTNAREFYGRVWAFRYGLRTATTKTNKPRQLTNYQLGMVRNLATLRAAELPEEAAPDDTIGQKNVKYKRELECLAQDANGMRTD